MKAEKGLVLVVSGPSGSGKNTVIDKAMAANDNFVFSISATTRKPRGKDIDGVNYFFKTVQEFEEMIEKGDLLEWTSYCGNYYGTPKDFIDKNLSEGKDIIIEIEIEGAQRIKELLPESVLMFVIPPSLAVLEERIQKRGTESDEAIKKRLNRSLEEIEVSQKYDYILINDDLNVAVSKFNAIVQAEKIRAFRKSDFVKKILEEGFDYER